MKARLSVASLALVALIAVGTLTAADKPALKCPVSGQPAKEDKTADFNGGKVQFCCENCPKAFEKDTAKFAAKANHQLFLTGQLKQTKCPLTGRPVAAGKSVDVAGAEVGLCCPGCVAKAKKASGDDLIALIFGDTTKGFEKAK
jgi:hypothetical protein